MHIFQVSVNDYFYRIYKTIGHDTKTAKDFEKDLTRLMNKHLKKYFDCGGETFNCKHKLFDFIVPELEKLGYEIIEIEKVVHLDYVEFNTKNAEIYNQKFRN